jgi:hypothetical protein
MLLAPNAIQFSIVAGTELDLTWPHVLNLASLFQIRSPLNSTISNSHTTPCSLWSKRQPFNSFGARLCAKHQPPLLSMNILGIAQPIGSARQNQESRTSLTYSTLGNCKSSRLVSRFVTANVTGQIAKIARVYRACHGVTGKNPREGGCPFKVQGRNQRGRGAVASPCLRVGLLWIRPFLSAVIRGYLRLFAV